MKPTVSIIIVSSNTVERTKNVIKSVFENTMIDYELIVVDIGSTDETIEFLKEHKDVKLLLSKESQIIPAYNEGINSAIADNIILLSPKVVTTPNWVDELLKCAEANPSAGIIGAANVKFNYKLNKETEPYFVEQLKEHCLLIKRSVINQVGLFDEVYKGSSFVFDDLYLRIKLAGFELFYCPQAQIKIADEMDVLDTVEYLDIYQDDRKRFINKWGDFLPLKNDIFTQILKNIPFSKGNILYLGDIPIIPNTLRRRGYSVDIYPRCTGYEALEKCKAGSYDGIIFFDNITHEKSFIKIIQDAKKLLRPNGIIIANINNSLYIKRLHNILNGNFSILGIEKELYYPIACLSKPEIIAWGEIANLTIIYLAGFATKLSPEYQDAFIEMSKLSISSKFIKEECSIQEYLVMWQKTD